MGFSLVHKEHSWYSFTSNNNFEKMRGYRYQAIFIQDNIYDHALADKVSIHALWVNELIPPIEPWVFRLPKEQTYVHQKGNK